MAWRDRLSPASFRDAPFFVEYAETSGGRKTVTHDYPRRDDVFVEDLGKRARAFSIDAYVVGPDYMDARDALLAALETLGPGTLIHPYYGTRLVALTAPYRVRESTDEGGMARFILDFSETAESPFAPGIVQVPTALVGVSADTALNAVTGSFTSAFRTVVPSLATGLASANTALGRSLPMFSFRSIAGVIQSASTRLHTVLGPVIRGAQQIATFKRQVDALYSDALTLARTPFTLATRLTTLFRSFATLASPPRLGISALVYSLGGGRNVTVAPMLTRTPRLGVQALLQTYAFTPPARPVASTLIRTLEQANYDAMLGFVRTVTVIQAARLAAAVAALPPASRVPDTDEAPTTGYETVEEAVAVLDAIVELLDEQAAAATDDDVYAALQQLRSDVVAAVPGPSHQLPHVVSVTPPVTIPSLVLAYQLYGSTALEGDLVARNRVKHPGFLVGGQSLKVLSHA